MWKTKRYIRRFHIDETWNYAAGTKKRNKEYITNVINCILLHVYVFWWANVHKNGILTTAFIESTVRIPHGKQHTIIHEVFLNALTKHCDWASNNMLRQHKQNAKSTYKLKPKTQHRCAPRAHQTQEFYFFLKNEFTHFNCIYIYILG